MTVRERVAAVTGAASGVGRATTLGLSRQGARVALCDLNTSGLAEVAATIQGAGGLMGCSRSAKELFQTGMWRLGKITLMPLS